MLLKSRASLSCFRACFLPGRAKDLSALRYKKSVSSHRWKYKNFLEQWKTVTIRSHEYRNQEHWTYLSFFRGPATPNGPGSTHFRAFTITLKQTRLGRTPLDEWSARRRDIYLTTYNWHRRQTSVPPQWDLSPQSQQASGRRPTP